MTAGLRSSAGGSSPLVAFVAIVSFGLLAMERNLATTGEWVATHLLFTYQDGFRKRALVGSLLRAVAPEGIITVGLATGVGILLLIVFVALAAGLVAVTVERNREEASTIILLGALMVASTHTRTLVTDVGRFDVILISLALILAMLSLWNTTAAAIAVFPIIGVGLLVHEVSLVATSPLMIMMIIHRLRTEGCARSTIVLIGVLSGVTAMLSAWFLTAARLDPDAAASALRSAAGRSDFTPTQDAVMIQSSSTGENISVAVGRIADVGPLSVMILLVVAIPALLVVRDATRREDGGPSASPLMLASLSPLSLALVGTDHGRWTMLVVLNLLILAVWWQGLPRAPGISLASPPALDPRRPRTLILFALALLLPSPSNGGLSFPGVMTSNGSTFRTSAIALYHYLSG